MQCPSCGSSIPADRRYAKLVVCASCRSAVILDEKAARVAGKMAVLAPTASRLYVGATGKIGTLHISVIGRVRYAYAMGFWDEWRIQFDDMSTGWITEDEGELTLEECHQDIQFDAGYDDLEVGMQVDVGDTSYTVAEKNVADCEGGEGQLPFCVLPGEKVPFCEMRAAEKACTLEFDVDDGTRVFVGRRLNSGELMLDRTADEAGMTGAVGFSAERAGDGERRERIAVSARRSFTIRCNQCAAPLTVEDPNAENITCRYCSAVTAIMPEDRELVTCPKCNHELDRSDPKRVAMVTCPNCQAQVGVGSQGTTLHGVLRTKGRSNIPFQVGQKCTFDGIAFVLIGYIRYTERDSDGRYHTHEFLLHNRKEGFRWLFLYEGHFCLGAELEKFPNEAGAIKRKGRGAKFSWGGRQWKLYERNTSPGTEVTWVEGELPWVATVGDKVKYLDAVCPPDMLSAEWTDAEMEWFESTYVEPTAVAKAFGIPTKDLPRRRGVGACQPFSRHRFAYQYPWVIAAFAVLFLVLAVLAGLTKGREAAKFTVGAEQYKEEYPTDPFTISEPNAVCTLKSYAPVSDQWVYLQIAVVHAESESVVLDFSTEMSYYSGVEGGERWSEGSTKDSKMFRLEKPGDYYLLIKGESSAQDKATITVREGVVPMRYYAMSAVACVAVTGLSILARGKFEAQRWEE